MYATASYSSEQQVPADKWWKWTTISYFRDTVKMVLDSLRNESIIIIKWSSPATCSISVGLSQNVEWIWIQTQKVVRLTSSFKSGDHLFLWTSLGATVWLMISLAHQSLLHWEILLLGWTPYLNDGVVVLSDSSCSSELVWHASVDITAAAELSIPSSLSAVPPQVDGPMESSVHQHRLHLSSWYHWWLLCVLKSTVPG